MSFPKCGDMTFNVACEQGHQSPCVSERADHGGQSEPQPADDKSSSSLEHERSLISILKDGSFFAKDKQGRWQLDYATDILPIIKKDFAAELSRLKRARTDREGSPTGQPRSYGVLLYGVEDGEKAELYHELGRTLTAVQALRWIKDDDRTTFNKELSNESWTWIRDRFRLSGLDVFETKNAEECYALLTSVIINDLGKDPQLPIDYKKQRQEDIGPDNHDMKLAKAIRADMVPIISTLDAPPAQGGIGRPDLLRDVLLGVDVSAECNLGQLSQAESVAASLYPVTRFRGRVRAWKLRFMEHILDLAGAKGHLDHTSAVVFGESVAQATRVSYDVCMKIIWDKWTPVRGYDYVLEQRYKLLQADGYRLDGQHDMEHDRGQHGSYNKPLNIANSQDKALMRLFVLGRVATNAMAQLYEAAFHRMLDAPEVRRGLVFLLNKDGISEPTVQMTYLPAMLAGALAHEWTSTQRKIEALQAVLKFVVKVMYLEQQELQGWKNEGVTVVERVVFDDLIGYVQTDQFFESPHGLVDRETPKSAITNRKEGKYARDYGF